ncbi:MAG: PAS domain-containing protein [Candidatus Eisenbacteria sp.]|nr:PAS domain-containing protein [Candidatus Eisenbacteria bacterium]
MRRIRLLWQVFPSCFIITLVALIAATVLASGLVRRFYLEQTTSDLESRAHLVREHVSVLLQRGEPGAIDALCKQLGRESSTRVTVILPSGQVVGDSEENPVRMELHSGPGRPEIESALRGMAARSIRYSRTLRRSMVYVAVPILQKHGDDARVVAAVRTSIPFASVRDALTAIYWQIALGALGVALLTAMASLLVARRIARPLEDLRLGAEAFARGELDRSLPVPNLVEIGVLAESMNQMGAELDKRIKTVTRQRNELEAILLSMTEGVVAVSTQARVVRMNATCARILGVDRRQVRGQTIQETLRNPMLQALVERALAGPEPVAGDVVLRNEPQRFLHVRGAPLRDAQDRQIGAVLVLNDVTHLRRLESMRRDFVANVSHELKTPITSIKGAIETLQDGAVADPEDATRFLDILARQADRLNAIIEDLLSLSRIERDTEQLAVALAENRIEPVLAGALQMCESKANERGIAMELSCDPALQARINAALLENAVVNLIDNAIKYSEAGQPVRIEAQAQADEIVISVRDQGRGIAAEHQGRIFERFYRVDKARSRSEGGTGLGLAIVKHIAKAQGGSVTLESAPGRGSTFRIHLPRS